MRYAKKAWHGFMRVLAEADVVSAWLLGRLPGYDAAFGRAYNAWNARFYARLARRQERAMRREGKI